MKVSNELIDKIKQFEGYRSKAYRCSAGVLTCGYGHTKGVTARTTCNKTKALAWLKSDLEPIERFLSAIPEVCKTQGRFDACADFCFNLGVNAFKGSTLLKQIQKKSSVSTIQAEFLKWVYAGGKPLEGLKNRRRWEAQRWVE
nr:MAG TPA: Lysozyme [Caudoviricetes sp.]